MRLPIWLCLLVLLPCAVSLRGQIVQLKSGHTLIGKIENPTEEGLTLIRVDDGGVLELTWEHLSKQSEQRLKSQFNLSVDDVSEVMVRAVALRYEVGGGIIDSVTGRIIAESDSTLTVRRQGVDYPVRRSAIKENRPVEVPATDVYTVADFYAEQLAEMAPGEDADQHIAFADVLIRVRDYDNAKRHLEQAKELGGGRQSNTLDTKLKYIARLKESARERALIDQVRMYMARRDFKKGLEAIESYEQGYGERGKLRGDFVRVRERFQQVRDRSVIGDILDLWRKEAHFLSRSKAIDPTMNYEAARAYAEEQMGRDIRAKIQRVLQLDADEVEELWAKRFEQRGMVRGERYSYGEGSWTLGKDQILKGTKQGKSEAGAKPKSKAELAQERTNRRLERAIERAQRRSSQRGQEGAEATPESWWKQAKTDQRAVWLRAYYAEHSGDLEVTSAHVEPCVTCAGLGYKEVYGPSGELEKADCPACRRTRFKRWIRAK